MRIARGLLGGAALLVLGAGAADARAVSVSLTASWPSSPLFPLLETRCVARVRVDQQRQ